jgi:8-oxo-dGTP diphosphatase
MKVLTDIEWDHWTPQQQATILFVRHAGRILLIHKKRGLGAGKINGPGGRLEAGETPRTAAIRECQEELCITPENPHQCGELLFQFVDGLSIHVHVFLAHHWTGSPTETDEAKPLWVNDTDIPYARMWADDAYWMPLMLNGKSFYGRFLFDGDTMLDHSLQVPSPLAAGYETDG